MNNETPRDTIGFERHTTHIDSDCYVMLTKEEFEQLRELAEKVGGTNVNDFLGRLARINPDMLGAMFPEYDPD